MTRVCIQCGKILAQKNPANLCFTCQEGRRGQDTTKNDELIDAEGYAYLLGLDSAETLKRKAREGGLAPRVPRNKKWLWRKDDIEAWFKQEQRKGDAFRRLARGIASNLRTCLNDPIICLSPSDKIGSKVYGTEYTLGTVGTGQVAPLKLVKIPRSPARRMLQQLPAKDFPELKGIDDWSALTYNRIHEAFIVKLETYF